MTIPCTLNKSQYKSTSLLLLQTDKNEEHVHSQLVSNYSKLIKSRDTKPQRDITQCIVTSNGIYI